MTPCALLRSIGQLAADLSARSVVAVYKAVSPPVRH